MDNSTRKSRILGLAFVLQFCTSLFNGAFFQGRFLVPGDVPKTLSLISGSPELFMLYILIDILTALGVAFLGALLFSRLRMLHFGLALTGFAFYLLEACLLIMSKVDAFVLLRTSLVSVGTTLTADQALTLQVLLEKMDFAGNSLHMLIFCLGAFFLYLLLDRARIVPRALSLWGLLTVPFLFLWTLLGLFRIQVPFFLYLPYVPFELFIGVWILIKGVPAQNDEYPQ